MVKKEIEMSLSQQARLLIESMPEVNEEELFNWVLGNGITLGGEHVISFLQFKKKQEEEKKATEEKKKEEVKKNG